MPVENGPKQRILETARAQFVNHGFSKVTTDEITGELGISKKTLYKYFPSKEALLQEVLNLIMEEIRVGAEEIIHDQDLEFITKLRDFMTFLGGKLAELRPPFLHDIQKNAPRLWKNIETFRKEMIHTRFANLIGQGMQLGKFRNDVNQQLVVLIFLHSIQNIINPETLSRLPVTASGAFEAVIRTIFEGILTDEARMKLHDQQINN